MSVKTPKPNWIANEIKVRTNLVRGLMDEFEDWLKCGDLDNAKFSIDKLSSEVHRLALTVSELKNHYKSQNAK